MFIVIRYPVKGMYLELSDIMATKALQACIVNANARLCASLDRTHWVFNEGYHNRLKCLNPIYADRTEAWRRLWLWMYRHSITEGTGYASHTPETIHKRPQKPLFCARTHYVVRMWTEYVPVEEEVTRCDTYSAWFWGMVWIRGTAGGWPECFDYRGLVHLWTDWGNVRFPSARLVPWAWWRQGFLYRAEIYLVILLQPGFS